MKTTPTPLNKIRPNDLCFCGSGRKFKRCHRPTTDRITAGQQTPRREVPADIEAPSWAVDAGGSDRSESDVKAPEVVERLRRTGRLAGEVLQQVGAAVAPGVTTDELDELCHRLSIEASTLR